MKNRKNRGQTTFFKVIHSWDGAATEKRGLSPILVR